MRKRLLMAVFLAFVTGAVIGDRVGRWRMADRSALGELYPAVVGQRIQKSARVLELLKRNELDMAEMLLRQDIEISLSVIDGLRGAVQIGEAQEKAFVIGKQVLAENPATNGVNSRRIDAE